MANPCLPHLPEAVYDVQAEVRPIHNTKLIWLLLLPGMAASVVIFGVSYDSYVTTLEDRTTIRVDYAKMSDVLRPMECSMLTFKSSEGGVTIVREQGGDWDVWSLGAGSDARFMFGFANVYWPNLEACQAEMTATEQSKPGSICRRLAADLYVNRTKCDRATHPDTCPEFGCMRRTYDVDSYIELGTGDHSKGRSQPGDGGIVFQNAQYDFDTSNPPSLNEGGGLTQMRGPQGNGVTADYDCEAKFTEHWCTSGVFAEQASQNLCAQTFSNRPPYSCVEQVSKYTATQALALAWSNTQMLWAVNLFLLVTLLRRLPGANASANGEGATVTRAANKHVV